MTARRGVPRLFVAIALLAAATGLLDRLLRALGYPSLFAGIDATQVAAAILLCAGLGLCVWSFFRARAATPEAGHVPAAADPNPSPGPIASPPPSVPRESRAASLDRWFESKISGHPRLSVLKWLRYPALMAGITLAVLAYGEHAWGTVDNFIRIVSHGTWILGDFHYVYYPMGRFVLSSHQPVQGFLYSAFAALIFYPFGQLSIGDAEWAWGLTQLLMDLGLALSAAALARRLSARFVGLSTVMVLTSFPMLDNFYWGQVSVLLVLGVVASFLAYQRDQRVLSGVLLGIVASIKYYPGVFAVYYVVRKDYRSLAALAVSILLCYGLLPIALLGWHDWLAFHTQSSSALMGLDWQAEAQNSQYMGFVVARLLKISPVSPTPAELLAGLGVAVALGNLVRVWFIERTSKAADRVALSAACLLLSLPFIVKSCWAHYLAYLPCCQLLVLTHVGTARLARTWQKALLFSLCAVSVVLSSTFFFNWMANFREYSRSGMLFISDFLALTALHLLLVFSRRSSTAGEGEGAAMDPALRRETQALGGDRWVATHAGS